MISASTGFGLVMVACRYCNLDLWWYALLRIAKKREKDSHGSKAILIERAERCEEKDEGREKSKH